MLPHRQGSALPWRLGFVLQQLLNMTNVCFNNKAPEEMQAGQRSDGALQLSLLFDALASE